MEGMSDNKKIVSGFGVDIFAGVPVKDYKTSLAWYERLFGCPPSFFPNEVEAVWEVAEHQWIYIIQDPKRAGHSIQNVMGKDLDKLIKEISERGLDFSKEELPAEGTRKIMYYDPDGNEIGFISVAER